jgi:hypothetical protein
MSQVKYSSKSTRWAVVRMTSVTVSKVVVVNVNWNADNQQWNVNANQLDDNQWNAGNQVLSCNSQVSLAYLGGSF